VAVQGSTYRNQNPGPVLALAVVLLVVSCAALALQATAARSSRSRATDSVAVEHDGSEASYGRFDRSAGSGPHPKQAASLGDSRVGRTVAGYVVRGMHHATHATWRDIVIKRAGRRP
jgi:hypothetical protein